MCSGCCTDSKLRKVASRAVRRSVFKFPSLLRRALRSLPPQVPAGELAAKGVPGDVNTLHLCQRVPAFEQVEKSLELVLGALGLDLNAAIRAVANVSLEAVADRLPGDEITVADTLDPAADDHSQSRHAVGFHHSQF